MIINVVKNIKVIHPKDVLLVKIGNFYHAYGRDSYILSYFFGYKVITIEEKISSCGFALQSLNKVIAKLEEKRINYIVVDRRNNYDIDLVFDFGNLNTYDEYYNKSKVFVNYKKRIDNIYNFLSANVQHENFREILQKMEEVINEG